MKVLELIHFKAFSKQLFKRLAAGALAIVTILSLMISVMDLSYARNGILDSLGSNNALGSPVLNNDAVTEDWNKWETIVWGIFLSNFCTPFIDSYESAFNLSASSGSEGSGTMALSFASGSDIANSQTLQDLTTYAINNQSTGARKIEVSYNRYFGGGFLALSMFNSSSNTGSTETTDDGTYTQSQTKRDATLADLFLVTVDNADDADVNASWTDFSKFKAVDWVGNIMKGAATGATTSTLGVIAIGAHSGGATLAAPPAAAASVAAVAASTAGGAVVGVGVSIAQQMDNAIIQNVNYPDMAAVTNANLPTFAVDVNGNYKVVLDFINTWDISMFNGAITRALSGDFRDKVADLLNVSSIDELNQYPLYLDSYGNITFMKEGQLIVVIPASANQYLTQEPSYNLVNSLVFNAGSATNSKANMLNFAGQDAYTDNLASDFFNSDNYFASGILAFSNGQYTKSSGMAIFYDTDTLAAQSHTSFADTMEINTGALYKEFFDLDINDEANDVPFKIEPYNTSEETLKGQGLNNTASSIVSNALESSSSLTNFLRNDTADAPKLTYILDYTKDRNAKDAEIPLFENSFIIPVQIDPGVSDKGKLNQWSVYRNFVDFCYQVYEGKISDVSPSLVSSAFSKWDNPHDLAKALIGDMTTKTDPDDVEHPSELTQAFWRHYTDLFSVSNQANLSAITIGAMFNWGSTVEMLAYHDVSNTDNAGLKTKYTWDNTTLGGLIDAEGGDYIERVMFGRSVKVYQTSPTLEQVCSILGLREGTDFSVYASYIYLTYLDWYNLDFDTLTGEPKSDLDPLLFTEESLIQDINVVTNIKSEEDMQKEILQYTYMLLNPTSEEGQNYRNLITMSNLQTTIYEQYQRIVYGSASTYNYNMMTTRNNTGFLAVENYSTNFMTAWLMSDYTTYAVYLIGIGIVLVVIVGVLKQRKTSWFLLAIVLVINVVLVLPATGEIVPYVSNNVVQDIFSDKMTYWSLSEQISNADTESQLLKQQESMSDVYGALGADDAAQVFSIAQTVKSVYLDRFINIQQDISNKVTSSTNTAWEEAQQFKSTRWLLPMILRQFTNSEGTADYVYVPLSDKAEDLSNMYWFYRPDDALYSQTVNGQAEATGITPATYENSSGLTTESGRITAWNGYTEPDRVQGLNYKSISYERNTDLPHTYFYLIDTTLLAMPEGSTSISDYDNVEDWSEAYATELQSLGNIRTDLEDTSARIQEVAGTYDRYDRSTMNQVYGYLWITESPLHYFYEVAHDSFQNGVSLGAIVSDLQGYYVMDPATNEEQHISFMIDEDTHGVRDVLDLEHLFTNVIPYMYSVQLAAGGVDGTSGVFGADTIQDYEIYRGNLESWLFRSNWVTKLMGNQEYSTSADVYYYDASGNRIKATVANQLMPSCYPTERPMVFSEAQRISLGLAEGDLNLIELKCIELNQEIYRTWTLMLNYVGENGITRDVVLKQMAIDATMAFSKAMTPTKLFNDSWKLYPDSLDIRSISFDSIMCMLMLNVTHNNSFIYGDTMEVVIDDFDLFTSILLLVVAWLCAVGIPFVRCVVLGLLFYLGYLSVIRALFKDNRTKVNTSIGYICCHILYLVVNIVYLYVFKMLISMTTSEDVLTIPSAEINTGNPGWCLIVVLIINILYIVASYFMFRFVIKNYKDMGMEVFRATVEMVSMNVSSTMEKLSDKLSEFASSGSVGDSPSGGSGSASSYNSLPDGSGSGSGGGSGAAMAGAAAAGAVAGGVAGAAIASGMSDTAEDYDDNYYYNNGGTGGIGDDSDDIDRKIDEGKVKREEAEHRGSTQDMNTSTPGENSHPAEQGGYSEPSSAYTAPAGHNDYFDQSYGSTHQGHGTGTPRETAQPQGQINHQDPTSRPQTKQSLPGDNPTGHNSHGYDTRQTSGDFSVNQDASFSGQSYAEPDYGRKPFADPSLGTGTGRQAQPSPNQPKPNPEKPVPPKQGKPNKSTGGIDTNQTSGPIDPFM